MRIRPAIVILKENKVLLLRYEYGGKSLYQFPGGNTEEAESLEKTLERELLEELNLPVSISTLLISAQVINETKNQATLHCLFKGGILANSIPTINRKETTAIEVLWIDVAQLDTLNLYPSVGIELQKIVNQKITSPVYLGVIEQPWI